LLLNIVLTLDNVVAIALRAGRRPRAFVGVTGPDAEEYLQRMLSNDVEALSPGEACEALLLTAKARLIAPLVVFRRGPEDFLLLTEPELGGRVRDELLRFRFAAKAAIEPEEHESWVVLGAGEGGIPCRDYGVPAVETLGGRPDAADVGDDELELLRIRAGTPRWGRELDERVLPAEAGLDARGISFTKGCYPGQEPVARLHYRGHANRGLRVLLLEGGELPAYDAELTWEGKPVGRITSAARDPEGGVACLAYVRTEVPADARMDVGSRAATQLH
jgi:folate-binding protein YgfZ